MIYRACTLKTGPWHPPDVSWAACPLVPGTASSHTGPWSWLTSSEPTHHITHLWYSSNNNSRTSGTYVDALHRRRRKIYSPSTVDNCGLPGKSYTHLAGHPEPTTPTFDLIPKQNHTIFNHWVMSASSSHQNCISHRIRIKSCEQIDE